MDASEYRDDRSLNSITFGTLIDRYTVEIGAIRPFGNNKAVVLKSLRSIIIRDRKHPTEKTGNEQEMPLLGKAPVENAPDLVRPRRIDTLDT